MYDCCIPKKVLGIYFGGRRHVGKPGGRWEDAVWNDAVGLIQIMNWKAAASKGEGWRKEIGEAIDRKWTEVP
jgi:hypothetical protein